MPKGRQFIRHLSEKLEDYTVVLLLPLFFASTGLNMDVRQPRQLINAWLYSADRLRRLRRQVWRCHDRRQGSGGLEWREASAIGILMNTRGLMELRHPFGRPRARRH